MMAKHHSWLHTFVTQICLCALSLFAFIYSGKLQKLIPQSRNGRTSFDVCFITVSGGSGNLEEQIRLLKTAEKVAGTYRSGFVINISELGDEDPLTQNATWYPQLSKIPWFTTGTMKGKGPGYFIKMIQIPFEETLDIIAVDTASLQDPSNNSANDQKEWLTRVLESSTSTWRIAVGFHPLISCPGNTDKIEVEQEFDPLYHLFIKYGVNAYLSGLAFPNTGVTADVSSTGPITTGPYYTTINPRTTCIRDVNGGFLLHRMSSLEFETYVVSLAGEVVQKVAQQQMGKESM